MDGTQKQDTTKGMNYKDGERPSDDGVEILAKAEELFEAGDYYLAGKLYQKGKPLVQGDAAKEAEDLRQRLGLDKVALYAGILFFLLLVFVWWLVMART
ncbi:MAG: hypothetical protein GXP49_16710 [Deltaproteobacteria bacterium]|nr:hypothetical protein [Deltaproteobacteria bacterium]